MDTKEYAYKLIPGPSNSSGSRCVVPLQQAPPQMETAGINKTFH
jgi:hypothetical protein